MNAIKRPFSITNISWLFIAAGTGGFVYHATEFNLSDPFRYNILFVCVVRLVAIACGLFMLGGHNWARWLLVVWLAYHIILSAFHTWSELVIHVLLFAVLAFFLFRPKASAFFHRASPPNIATSA